MKRFLRVSMMLVILFGVSLSSLVGGQPAVSHAAPVVPPEATVADQPVRPPGDEGQTSDSPAQLPRHRPGHVARSKDLRLLLAENEELDPLSGNYQLLELNELLVVWSEPLESTPAPSH